MSERRVILTVDRNRRNLELLSQFLGKAGYESVSAFTAMFRRAFGTPPTRYFSAQQGSHTNF